MLPTISKALLKKTLSLKQKKFREIYHTFLVEGIRTLEMVPTSQIKNCFFTKPALQNERYSNFAQKLTANSIPCYSLEDEQIKKLADTATPAGVIATIQKPPISWENFCHSLEQTKQPPKLLILDAIQDPGNVGTIIRTADAAGFSGIIALTGTADIFTEKTIRATMGSLFHLPIVEKVTVKQLTSLKEQYSLCFYAGVLSKQSISLYQSKFNLPLGIILGNEGNGISPAVLSLADTHLEIPMYGQAESLNVASAAAIIIYEAVRQTTSSAPNKH